MIESLRFGIILELIDRRITMITEDEIKRINELAKKSKTDEGLSEDEKKEQHKLRRKYIDSFKTNLRSHLDTIKPDDKNNNKES